MRDEPTEISMNEYHAIKQASKYRNEREMIDGYTFDSKQEARRYEQLRLLLQAGHIRDLAIHPIYELQPAFIDQHGNRHRAITYEADFAYQENDRTFVEDVKGVLTQAFLIKYKLFAYRYTDLEFRIVRVRLS